MTINLYGIIIINKGIKNYSDTINRIEKDLNDIVTEINSNGTEIIPLKLHNDFYEILISSPFICINDKDKNYVMFQIGSENNPINKLKITFNSNLNFHFESTIIKLISTIEDAIDQHENSDYKNKIFFIDSEALSDFQFPLILDLSLFEETKIVEYIEKNFSNNYIFCFIFRNYYGEVPKVEIKAYGNNISPYIKTTLESLKTNFAYRN